MIKLTPKQAKTYEGIKLGLTVVEVAKHIEVNESTVRHHVKRLILIGMIKQKGKQSHSKSYEAFDVPYTITYAGASPKSKVAVVEDKFISKAVNANISDDIIYYLIHNKDKKRSLLKKTDRLISVRTMFRARKVRVSHGKTVPN